MSQSKIIADEIFTRFDHCDFRDPLGHKLTLCQDFIDLVEMAVAASENGLEEKVSLILEMQQKLCDAARLDRQGR